MAAGKTATAVHYDITDFANLAASVVREEVVSSGTNGAQLVWRTGPRKPKLSSLSIPQWSVANLAILSRLQDDGNLDSTSVMDYLSYTTRIYQLFQRYEAVSVFLYDREYRKLQAQLSFRWGTEVTHLQAMWLKEQEPRPIRADSSAASSKPGPSSNTKGPITADGRIICRLYNSKAGCTLAACKYAHLCSRQGCQEGHSSIQHETISKN